MTFYCPDDDWNSCSKISVGFLVISLLVPFVFLVLLWGDTRIYAKTPDQLSGYKTTADGGAWTIDEPVVNKDGEPIRVVVNSYSIGLYSDLDCWTEVNTVKRVRQETLFEKQLEPWQHFYSYTRAPGRIPVYKWVCTWERAHCQHGNFASSGMRLFHGLEVNGRRCGRAYYSGWLPYCSDCGRVVYPMIHYFREETVEQIDTLDTSKDYYYLCPHEDCRGLEQGCWYGKHICQAVSANKYRIVYHYDTSVVKGNLQPSFHMYNDDSMYQGEEATNTQTHLQKVVGMRIGVNGEKSDALVWKGHTFLGWATSSDGPLVYTDGQKVRNLTTENYDEENPETGTVHLYAVWEEAKSSFCVDPAGGKYEGKSGVQRYSLGYQEQKTVHSDELTPPSGYEVSFVTNGGNSLSKMNSKKEFLYWKEGSMKGSFVNKGKEGIYIANVTKGTEDLISAVYGNGGIVLPTPKKANTIFLGWCTDKACNNVIGTGGDTYVPVRNTVLYAKWGELLLTAAANYKDNQGRGAVDLSWGWEQPASEPYYYIPYQSIDKLTLEFDKVHSAVEGSDTGENIGKKEYTVPGTYTLTIPSTGYYEIVCQGAQGGTFTNSGKSYFGGKGGKIGAKVFFKKGDNLSIQVAGKGSTKGGLGNGGAGSSQGAGGGGFSSVKCGDKLCIAAGGGGGGSITSDGGAGGTENPTQKSQQGQNASEVTNGAGGGGGGYRGGAAGQYEEIYHSHSESCTYHKHTGSSAAGGGCYGTKVDGWTLCSTVRWSYAPCKYWWDYGNKRCVRCYGTDPDMVSHKDAYCNNPECFYYKDFTLGTSGDTEEVALTKGYWFKQDTQKETAYYAGHHYVWGTASWKRNCGYTSEGYLCGLDNVLEDLVSTASQGGSNFVCEDAIITCNSQAGVKSGDGSVTVEAITIGLIDESLSLNGVAAEDLAAPNALDEASFSIKEKENMMEVTFDAVEDKGTAYRHIVKAYQRKNANLVADSGISKPITLCVGLEAYYYCVDESKNTTVTKIGTGRTTNPRIVLSASDYAKLKEGKKLWLHVMASDKNGNCTKTVHVPMDDTRRIEKQIYTENMSIWSREGEGNVVASGSPKTYFVRADGKTPFSIGFTGYVSAMKKSYCLPDIYLFHVQDNHQEEILSIGKNLSEGELLSSVTGDSLLQGCGGFLEKTLSDGKGQIRGEVILPVTLDGRKLTLFPKAGCYLESSQVLYSIDTNDREQMITLLPDGEGPTVLGLDQVKVWCQDSDDLTDFNQELVLQDAVSGVKLLTVKIVAGDGTLIREQTTSENHFRLQISGEVKKTYGDFMLSLLAEDAVGNQTRVEIEGSGYRVLGTIERVLSPHEPVFKTGESGWLHLMASAKVDQVEVVFPKELVEKDTSLNQRISFPENAIEKRKTILFQVPLGVPEREDYEVEIYSYSGGILLSPEPIRCTFSVKGNILEEIRTRLR